MSALTSDVEVVAAGGEVVGPVVGDALVPADVIPADGGKVEEAFCALHHRRLTIIWGQKHTNLIIFIWQPSEYSPTTLQKPVFFCHDHSRGLASMLMPLDGNIDFVSDYWK